MLKDTIILGIESSCDDTGAAIIMNDKILSNVISSQLIHQKHGGVVPELASRAHQANIITVVNQAFQCANIDKKRLAAISFTKGPGLLGSLLVGSSFAKSLALALGIPAIAIHHIRAHILAHFIDDSSQKKPKFPFLCLTISGGHTQLVIVRDYFDFEVIGQTKDDAAGEAFDKIGKNLGLSYPAGPKINKLAKKGNPKVFSFTRPKVSGYDFSFSGLKTQVLYFLQDQTKKNNQFIDENLTDLCASVQFAIIDILIEKLKRATLDFNIHRVAIAGGVSANSELRDKLLKMKCDFGWEVYIPKLEYTTDNAAMVAMAGMLRFQKKLLSSGSELASARWDIQTI